MSPPHLLTIAEAAELLDVSVRRVQQFCQRRQLKGARKYGRDWRIPRDELKKFAGRARPSHRPKNKE